MLLLMTVAMISAFLPRPPPTLLFYSSRILWSVDRCPIFPEFDCVRRHNELSAYLTALETSRLQGGLCLLALRVWEHRVSTGVTALCVWINRREPLTFKLARAASKRTFSFRFPFPFPSH